MDLKVGWVPKACACVVFLKAVYLVRFGGLYDHVDLQVGWV